jgi:hypothetical protein
MITNSRLQRRIVIYSYFFKMLGILSEQEYSKIIEFDQVHVHR